MMITFLAASHHSPLLATRYCEAPLDAMGRARDEVRVLRGSSRQFEQVAMGLSFREKYKSAVIAFAPDDDPSDEDIEAILDDFREVCFAGLDKTRFCFVAYLHRSPDKVDLHVLLAKVDLLTGLQFNAAPPGWERDFDPLRDAWNWRMGWARPDDPRRARALQPGAASPGDAARIRAGLAVEPDTKKLLAEMLTARVRAGVVNNRADVVAALSEFGEITRDPPDFVSVKLPGHAKAVRLRGTLFRADFDSTIFLAPRPSLGGRGEGAKTELDIDSEQEREARARLQAAIARRAVHNLHRYRLTTKRKKFSVASAPLPELVKQLYAGPPPTPPPDMYAIPTPEALSADDIAQPPIPIHQTTAPATVTATHDRTPHLFHQMFDDLVAAVRKRLDEFAESIRGARQRLAAAGRALGALAAVDREARAGAGKPGEVKGRVAGDQAPISHQRKSLGRFDEKP
ncbi:MAG: hypothetical protein ACRYGA_09485 [Janthinobacterium lividum]